MTPSRRVRARKLRAIANTIPDRGANSRSVNLGVYSQPIWNNARGTTFAAPCELNIWPTNLGRHVNNAAADRIEDRASRWYSCVVACLATGRKL